MISRKKKQRASRKGHVARIVLSIDGVCEATTLGRTKVYQLIREGRLPAYKVDGRTVAFEEDVRTLLRSEPVGGGGA